MNERRRDGRCLVSFPAEGVPLLLRTTHLGGDRYRLDEVPVGIESAGFRDQVEMERLESGVLRPVSVLERSGWETIDYALPECACNGVHAESVLEQEASTMAGTIPIPGLRGTIWRDRLLARPGSPIVLIAGAAALTAFAALWIAMILIALRVLH